MDLNVSASLKLNRMKVTKITFYRIGLWLPCRGRSDISEPVGLLRVDGADVPPAIVLRKNLPQIFHVEVFRNVLLQYGLTLSEIYGCKLQLYQIYQASFATKIVVGCSLFKDAIEPRIPALLNNFRLE